ncbi:hypothetical protein JHK82_044667 [Glycine max]|nr:hypothetical protein JHK82_044667 [Glycine max]KAG5108214.1 hypothetical protein JHK84_045121 [Glycine max]
MACSGVTMAWSSPRLLTSDDEVQYTLNRIWDNAKNLFTLDEKNLHRIFEGEALLHKMFRYYLLDETQNNLDYVFAFTLTF